MKQIIFAAILLAAMSCQKDAECTGAVVKCQHKFGTGFTVCPDPQDLTKLKFSEPEFHVETIEMSDCDTTSWLKETREWDQKQLEFNPSDPEWSEFSRMYPNTCGCE